MNSLLGVLLARPITGYRTYLTGLLMVLNGLYAYLYGGAAGWDGPGTAISDTEAIRMVLEGLGLGTLRAGIGSNGK